MRQRFVLPLLVLAACSENSSPTLRVPPDEPAGTNAAVSCSATVHGASLSCTSVPGASASRQGGARRLVLGGQGINVKVTSSNVHYDAATGIFSADVTVQNLLPEALGTADWITLNGVRVFFHSGPNATGGTGTVRVSNPDGVSVFTGSQQPYFEYLEPLLPNAVSTPKRWEWKLDPGVTSFSFALLVDGAREGDDPGSGRFARLSTGGVQACAITPGEQLYCWGSSVYGQVGSGDFGWHEAPVQVARGGSWSMVATGQLGSCGTRVDGTPYCWGRFTIPQSIAGDSLPCEMAYHCRPDLVNGGLRFHQVTVGTHHTCGLTDEGEVYCWGLAGHGALGVAQPPDSCDVGGPVPCAVLPVKVEGGRRFNDLTGGENHTCGIERGGDAWCWGENFSGQLGDGTHTHASAPVRVATEVRFAQLDTYVSTTCGLTPEGQAWCWGDNWHGQLGAGPGYDSPVPVKVQQGELRFLKLAVGFEHVCGLVPTGEAWCWGGNTFGQLGDGNGGDFNVSYVPVPVAGGLRFRDIDAGHLYTCGISRDGDPWCWGHGIGQPGTPGVSGSYTCHWEPCSLVPGRIRDPTS